jgi:hypothetical protein
LAERLDVFKNALAIFGVSHRGGFFNQSIEPAFFARLAKSSNIVDDSQPGKFTRLDVRVIE